MIGPNILHAENEKIFPPYHLFDESKGGRVALYCSKNIICIIKRNNVKT